MTEYTPDRWVILKIYHNEDTFYKVLASWSGSYTYGSSWRMNSGITHVSFDDPFYYIEGVTGSVYKVHKNMESFSNLTAGIYASLKETHGDDIKLITMEQLLLEYK